MLLALSKIDQIKSIWKISEEYAIVTVLTNENLNWSWDFSEALYNLTSSKSEHFHENGAGSNG